MTSAIKINALNTVRKLPLAIAVVAASTSCFAESVEDSNFMLEEIVVTAQKRSQSLQDVPMSVSAVSEQTMKNAGIQTVADVQRLVPALNIISSSSPANSSISIRGAGTSTSDPTLEPSVGMFVDGVFMPRSIFGLSDLVDVDRVEVLLGPQGTLYGKNTNSGVISVHTKGAPGAFEMNVETTIGEDNLEEVKFAVGGVITDEVGYRFAASSRRRDGLLEDDVTGDPDYNQLDKQAYRGQLFWDPTDELSVRAIAYYSLADANSAESESSLNTSSAYYTYLQGLGLPASTSVDPEDRKVSLSEPAGGRVEVQGASVQVDYSFNDLTLTSITAYQEWEQSDVVYDSDLTSIDIGNYSERMDEQSISQELRLTSPGGETIDWVAGFFYFKSDVHRGSKDDVSSMFSVGLPGIPSAPALAGVAANLLEAGDYSTFENKYKSESFALFGQATWNITDATTVTAGLRYGQEEKDFSMHVSAYDASGTEFNLANWGFGFGPYAGGSFLPLVTGALGPDAADFSDWGAVNHADDLKNEDVTGMLSVNHFIGDSMIYASVASGSKSGGFNGTFGPLTLAEREYDTEKTVNYEIGAKLDGLLGGRARVNMAYFYTEYKDFQAVSYDPVSVAFTVQNAGKQVTQGVDVEATYLATENLTLTVKAEYLDAKYKEYEGANCYGGVSCDLSGERLPGAANWTGALAADYILPLDNGSELYSHVGMSFKTQYNADPTGAPFAESRYEIWNARLGWRSDNWDLSLWGNNLTDETYVNITGGTVFGGVFAPADGGASYENYNSYINDPRSVGMTLRYTM
jgi:iron complex outermembrane recepter protein